jgi:hypothetical protein
VKEYLQEIWRIESKRITIAPPRRTADADAHLFARQEARRVAIRSESWEIHRPVLYRNVAIAQPIVIANIHLDMKVAPAEIAGIEMTIAADDRIVASGALPVPSDDQTSSDWFLIWTVPHGDGTLPSNLTFTATIRLTNGRLRFSNKVSAPVILDVDRWSADVWEDRASDLIPNVLSFYAAGDTTLDALRRMTLDNRLAALSELPGTSGEKTTLELTPYGEEGEAVDIDPVRMEQAAAAAEQTPLGVIESLTTRSKRNSFFVLTRAMLDVEAMSEEERMALAGELVGALYGIDMEELQKGLGERVDGYDGYGEDAADSPGINAPPLDSLLQHRADAVANHVRAGADSVLHATFSTSLSWSRTAALRPLPEERLYIRRVELRTVGNPQSLVPDNYDGYEFDELPVAE